MTFIFRLSVNKITLMGESAGAFSICFHLASPESAGLFHRVIIQSAMCDMKFQDYNGIFSLIIFEECMELISSLIVIFTSEAVQQGNRLVKVVECDHVCNINEFDPTVSFSVLKK